MNNINIKLQSNLLENIGTTKKVLQENGHGSIVNLLEEGLSDAPSLDKGHIMKVNSSRAYFANLKEASEATESTIEFLSDWMKFVENSYLGDKASYDYKSETGYDDQLEVSNKYSASGMYFEGGNRPGEVYLNIKELGNDDLKVSMAVDMKLYPGKIDPGSLERQISFYPVNDQDTLSYQIFHKDSPDEIVLQKDNIDSEIEKGAVAFEAEDEGYIFEIKSQDGRSLKIELDEIYQLVEEQKNLNLAKKLSLSSKSTHQNKNTGYHTNFSIQDRKLIEQVNLEYVPVKSAFNRSTGGKSVEGNYGLKDLVFLDRNKRVSKGHTIPMEYKSLKDGTINPFEKQEHKLMNGENNSIVSPEGCGTDIVYVPEEKKLTYTSEKYRASGEFENVLDIYAEGKRYLLLVTENNDQERSMQVFDRWNPNQLVTLDSKLESESVELSPSSMTPALMDNTTITGSEMKRVFMERRGLVGNTNLTVYQDLENYHSHVPNVDVYGEVLPVINLEDQEKSYSIVKDTHNSYTVIEDSIVYKN